MAVAHSIAADLTEAVIDGLAALFAGLADFNGTTSPHEKTVVSYGFDFGSNAAEQVYLGRMSGDTPPAGLRSGRNFRNEAGSFDLTVMVRLPGKDASEAMQRAFAIGHQVEDWIGERKSGEGLDVTGLQTLLVSSWAADYAGIDSGTGALLTYSVAWTARLDDSVTP
jgi:hypothetical protein